MKKLTIVTDGEQPTLYILWLDIDLDAYVELLEDCEGDYFITNYHHVLPADDLDLREHLQCLAAAGTVMLPDTWWTSVVGHQVVQIAAWLGCKFLDYEGTPIPTASLRGTA